MVNGRKLGPSYRGCCFGTTQLLYIVVILTSFPSGNTRFESLSYRGPTKADEAANEPPRQHGEPDRTDPETHAHVNARHEQAENGESLGEKIETLVMGLGDCGPVIRQVVKDP